MQNLVNKFDVFPGYNQSKFDNPTSIQRQQQILKQDFIEKFQISNICFCIWDGKTIRFGPPLYFGPDSQTSSFRKLKFIGDDSELITDMPMILSYADGGIEYLDGFLGGAGNQFSYKIELINPNNHRLHYSHPVKNEKLLKLLKR